MTIFMWPAGFKVRTKADAKRFLNMVDDKSFGGDGEVYWHDDENDYCLYIKKKQVGSRPQFARGNIFFPYLIETDPVSIIWETRKFLNAQKFSDERW